MKFRADNMEDTSDGADIDMYASIEAQIIFEDILKNGKQQYGEDEDDDEDLVLSKLKEEGVFDEDNFESVVSDHINGIYVG